jgi:hypothetical protein
MSPRMGSMGRTEQIPQVLSERHPCGESGYVEFSRMESSGRLPLARTQGLPGGSLAENSGGMGPSGDGLGRLPLARTQGLPGGSLAENSGGMGLSGDGLGRTQELPGGSLAGNPEPEAVAEQ